MSSPSQRRYGSAQASGELGHYTYTRLDEKPMAEEFSSKGILAPFKKVHTVKDHKWLRKTGGLKLTFQPCLKRCLDEIFD